MSNASRKIIDKSFTLSGFFSIGLMALALLIVIVPIIYKGTEAFVFKGTIEFRKSQAALFNRGKGEALDKEVALTNETRAPLYQAMADFKDAKRQWAKDKKSLFRKELKELTKLTAKLLGPAPGEKEPVLIRQRFGATRLDRAEHLRHEILFRSEWVPNPDDPEGPYIQDFVPRKNDYVGTQMEAFFEIIENQFETILNPQMTFYWQFIIDESYDAHFFGGIGPEILGTIYLTLGAILFAIPMGIIAAIYLCEYAKPSRLINLLRTCISTLAGVPSIVFGIFGLAFFINTIHVSESKSVLAGSLTLALMILPTIIRASEEAILAVPVAYKEGAMGLGAGKWHTIITVILPAALPGILTGIVISMGRAAGETAPIIFTAAVSLGEPVNIIEAFQNPTPALPWNIYNISTEHEAADMIRHVQYGMVFTLVTVVLTLNMFAIILRAKISKKLKG